MKQRLKNAFGGDKLILIGATVVVFAMFTLLNRNFLIIAGQNDLSPGSLAAFSGVLAALLVSQGLNLYLSFAITILAGALIGAKVTVDVVVSITKMWPYVLMVGACYMAFSLFLGWLLSHVADLDPVTATFASTAAGASDMALIAADFGTVTPAIAVCPTFISIILQIF